MKSNEKIGEREIIKIVQDHLDLMPEMPVAFGDDVSAYDIGDGNLAVLKTDMLVDKTDVPSDMSLWQAARKSVVMNISDFSAKGVKPLAVLVSLGLPQDLKERDIREIGEGLNAGAREYDTYIIGGDTNESSDLVISLSVFGMAKRKSLMLRSGAKNGDLVAVTGSFGKPSAGLKILLEGFKVSEDIRRVLVDSVLMPLARLKEGLALSQTEAVTACIDSSDGLAWSLHEIAKASNVGIIIHSLPVAKEVERFTQANKLDSMELTLYGGEEYELVFTLDPSLWNKVKGSVEKVGGRLLLLGKVVTGQKIISEINGARRIIEPRGWEHFKEHHG